MARLLGCVLVSLLVSTTGFQWGVTQCISPMHGVRRAAGPEGVAIYTYRGKIHVESGNPIKGFLLSGRDIIFSNPPADSELTSVCGGPGHGVSHTNSNNRHHIVVDYVCEEGVREADLSAYIVFTRSSPYVALDGRLGCPKRPTAEPVAVETSSAPVEPSTALTTDITSSP